MSGETPVAEEIKEVKEETKTEIKEEVNSEVLEDGESVLTEEEKTEETEEEKKDKDEKTPEEEKSVESTVDEDIAQLKQDRANDASTITKLTNQLADQNKILEDQGFKEPEDADEAKENQRLLDERDRNLDQLFEVMKVSPKYPDLEEVLTTANTERVIKDATETMLKTNPEYSYADAELAVRETIEFDIANPYSFFYDRIKALDAAGEKKTPEAKKEEIGEKKPKAITTPTSIAGMTTPGKSTGGWTDSKINELNELELDKVPDDVMEAFEAGKLPK